MFRVLFCIVCQILVTCILQAQTGLPMMRNLDRVYANGTRDRSGAPGPNYWQNRSSYFINAELNPYTRQVRGSETITYENNSPDTLRTLRLKLEADRYRKGRGRSGDVPPSDVTDDGVVISNLIVGEWPVPEEKQIRYATFLDIRLDKPVLPGSQVKVAMNWTYTLPADASAAREYAGDSTVFFVPYWYPEMAVYDDVRGWADFPYTGLQEFYHDFSDYEVYLRMPKGFMVWATGEWLNPEKILTEDVLGKWSAAHAGEEVTAIFTEADLKAGKVFKPNAVFTFHYKATGVPDFVFAASNRYNWDAASVEVDAKTKRRTMVSAVYDTQSEDYFKVCSIAANGIRLMSNWQPGYPFPYPYLTVFNGNDGMEFPMFCNDASQGKRDPTGLTVHETAHTYFPFMMGINEQEYAWMDEGWASFFDFLLTDSLVQGSKGRMRGYGQVAGTDVDVPLMTRSRFLSNPAYRIASYTRPQAAYLTLLDVLGYDAFHRCMTGYMDRWKGKHPIPYDFFYTWNDLSGQNLDWFWKPWFFEWGFPDLAIQSVENKNPYEVVVEKVGNQPIPVELTVQYTDGSSEVLYESAAVWKTGNREKSIPLAKGKTPETITLGGRTIPDANPSNDIWRR